MSIRSIDSDDSDDNIELVIRNKYGWNKINIFETKKVNIIKIAISSTDSVFVAEDGNVWRCVDVMDDNYEYNYQMSYIPEQMRYFITNIKIKDVECGASHTLALSKDGRVYAWGTMNMTMWSNGHLVLIIRK